MIVTLWAVTRHATVSKLSPKAAAAGSHAYHRGATDLAKSLSRTADLVVHVTTRANTTNIYGAFGFECLWETTNLNRWSQAVGQTSC